MYTEEPNKEGIDRDSKDFLKRAAQSFIIENQPIYKGCKNEKCNCTGECREIIGYKKKYLMK